MLPEDMSSFEQAEITIPDLTAVPEIVEMAAAIAQIEEKAPVVKKYRTLQGLQLTDLQHKVLSKVTDQKLNEAKLRDLMDAFKTLKTMEHLVDGKPTEIKGLVAYLVAIEQEKAQIRDADVVDVTDNPKSIDSVSVNSNAGSEN